ncbi:hypothetical protein K438DRAFT_1757191 [Mycena galopus ATCC 62051]|nr:hypothetical protein K438DRAFT_1757191 [Mycena galopus ATCC 62051]
MSAAVFGQTFATVIRRQPTANDIVGNINTSLNIQAAAVTATNVFPTGAQIQIQHLASDVMAMQGSPSTSFSAADQKTIASACTNYITVLEQALSVLIGKQGIFSLTPLAPPPIAAYLRGIEGALNSFGFAVIDVIPTQASAILLE